MDNTIRELQDEVKHQRGLNRDLELKLTKQQESKIDLKLQKINEKQKMEMADLSMNSLQFEDAEINSHVLEDSKKEDFSLRNDVLPEKMRKEFCHLDADLHTYENAITCLYEGIELQEFQNWELEHQLM
ncbi:hypothetical protein JHK84_039669 [Glycine max]|nr:hypothetical protein JHK86_039443 [Glycine max]KAG4965047.1 hypothetical protein JHK85_040022 [Glycine max]KAG5121329.1 hypothetical protein JHK84_039669 [Glycine max]